MFKTEVLSSTQDLGLLSPIGSSGHGNSIVRDPIKSSQGQGKLKLLIEPNPETHQTDMWGDPTAAATPPAQGLKILRYFLPSTAPRCGQDAGQADDHRPTECTD